MRRKALEREVQSAQRRLGHLILRSRGVVERGGREHLVPEESDRLARLLALKIRDLRAEIAAIDRAERRPLVVFVRG